MRDRVPKTMQDLTNSHAKHKLTQTNLYTPFKYELKINY